MTILMSAVSPIKYYFQFAALTLRGPKWSLLHRWRRCLKLIGEESNVNTAVDQFNMQSCNSWFELTIWPRLCKIVIVKVCTLKLYYFTHNFLSELIFRTSLVIFFTSTSPHIRVLFLRSSLRFLLPVSPTPFMSALWITRVRMRRGWAGNGGEGHRDKRVAECRSPCLMGRSKLCRRAAEVVGGCGVGARRFGC